MRAETYFWSRKSHFRRATEAWRHEATWAKIYTYFDRI